MTRRSLSRLPLFFFTLKPISLLWYEPFSLLTRLFHSCCLISQQSGEIMQIKTDRMVDEKPTGVLFWNFRDQVLKRFRFMLNCFRKWRCFILVNQLTCTVLKANQTETKSVLKWSNCWSFFKKNTILGEHIAYNVYSSSSGACVIYPWRSAVSQHIKFKLGALCFV